MSPQEAAETAVSTETQGIISAALDSIRTTVAREVEQASVDLRAITEARTSARTAIATMISLETKDHPLLKAHTDEEFFTALAGDKTLAERFLRPEVRQLLTHISTLTARVASAIEATADILGRDATETAAPAPAATSAEDHQFTNPTTIKLLAYIRAAVAEGTQRFENTPELQTRLGCRDRGTSRDAFLQLVEAGLLTVEGKGRGTRYIATPERFK